MHASAPWPLLFPPLLSAKEPQDEVVGEETEDLPKEEPVKEAWDKIPVEDIEELDATIVKPPPDEEKIALARLRLKRGRVNMTLVNAKNVRRKDQIAAPTNLNPYAKAIIGRARDPPTIKSTVRAGAARPAWGLCGVRGV